MQNFLSGSISKNKSENLWAILVSGELGHRPPLVHPRCETKNNVALVPSDSEGGRGHFSGGLKPQVLSGSPLLILDPPRC